MTISQLSTLPQSLRIQFLSNYAAAGKRARLYDMFARPIDQLSAAAGAAQAMADLKKGGTVRVTFISDMSIGTTPLSEIADINPQTLEDTTKDVNVDFYGDAIQVSEKALIERFTDYGARMARAVGLNAMEAVDFQASNASLIGTLVTRPSNVSRANLNAGTHDITHEIFANVAARLSQFNTPGWEGEGRPTNWAALTNHFVVADLAKTTPIVNIAQYQDGQKDMILNNEIGIVHSFKILANGRAKIFNGAGLANTNDLDTTLTTAATALDKTLAFTDAQTTVGQWVNLGTIETGSTHYPTNERAKVVGYTAGTATVVGEGENGGIRFDHAAGVVVNADDSAHTILFGGPQSLVKVFAPEIGEFATLVGPLKQGLAEQWESLAWKWFGGYGIVSENWLYRAEVSVSEEA